MAEERRITKQYLMEHLDENELDLSMINLSKVPVRELVQIPRVTKLDLSRNQITSLPDNISSLKTILELDLSKNQLTGLPESFGELSQLQKLDLYGNKLTELPLTFVGLERLHWLDLKNNPLSQGLAKAAGTCLDEKECKQCAKNVMVYVGEAAAEAEKKKKKTLDRKLARERKKQEEERRRKEAAKREKQELRQRRKKEREREQAQRMAEDHPDSQEEDTGTSTEVDEQESNGAKRTSCGSLCKLLIVLLSLLVVLSLCLFLYCEFTSDPSCKIFYQTAHAYFHRALDLIGISQ